MLNVERGDKGNVYIQQMVHFEVRKHFHKWWIWNFHLRKAILEYSSYFIKQQASLSIQQHHLLTSNIDLSLLYRFSTSSYPEAFYQKHFPNPMKTYKIVDFSPKIYKTNIPFWASWCFLHGTFQSKTCHNRNFVFMNSFFVTFSEIQIDIYNFEIRNFINLIIYYFSGENGNKKPLFRSSFIQFSKVGQKRLTLPGINDP